MGLAIGDSSIKESFMAGWWICGGYVVLKGFGKVNGDDLVTREGKEKGYNFGGVWLDSEV